MATLFLAAMIMGNAMAETHDDAKPNGDKDTAWEKDGDKDKADLKKEMEAMGPLDVEKVLNKLHEDNLHEVEMGQLGQSKGASQEIKDFGKKLEQDHQKADEDVKALAEEKGITLQEPAKDSDKGHMDKLNSLSGEEFDKKFAKIMSKDHAKTLALLDRAEKDVDDAQLKQLLAKLRPTLEEHKRTADGICEKSGGDKDKGEHGDKDKDKDSGMGHDDNKDPDRNTEANEPHMEHEGDITQPNPDGTETQSGTTS